MRVHMAGKTQVLFSWRAIHSQQSCGNAFIHWAGGFLPANSWSPLVGLKLRLNSHVSTSTPFTIGHFKVRPIPSVNSVSPWRLVDFTEVCVQNRSFSRFAPACPTFQREREVTRASWRSDGQELTT